MSRGPEVRDAGRLSAEGRGVVFAGLLAFLLACCAISLAHGSRPLPVTTIVDALRNYDAGNFDHQALYQFRLPRLYAAVLVGACLALSGALLQLVVRNPLAEPQLLGLNSGAALAVVGLEVLGASQGDLSRPVVASLGALVAFCATLGLSGMGRTGATPIKITLCGIVVSAFASSLTSALLLLDEQAIDDMRLWLSGDLGGQHAEVLVTILPFAGLAIAIAFFVAPKLELLSLGDDVARGLGVHLGWIRFLTLVSAATLSGVGVSIAGPIGLLGLIVPHLMRQLLGGRLRLVMASCLLAGPCVLISADFLARTLIAPVEISTGVMTGAAGAIAFIVLVVRHLK